MGNAVSEKKLDFSKSATYANWLLSFNAFPLFFICQNQIEMWIVVVG